MKTMLFNLLLKLYTSTEVAERVTNEIIKEARHGEQHVRDFLRKNVEFTMPMIDAIADVLFRSKALT
jgi:hypothetical protein